MSGVSHFVSKPMPRPLTGHDWTKHGNPPPSNYFKTREMNMHEIDYSDYYNYPDYNYGYYDSTYYQPTYELMCEQQAHYNDYVPAYVEEPQEEVPTDSQDFQIAPESEKQK